MNKLKLTVLLSVLFTSSFLFYSCSKDYNEKVINTSVLPVTRSQVVAPPTIPLPPSPATGTLSGSYDRNTNLFSYTLTWENLSDSAIAGHIHGLAEPGHFAIAPYASLPNLVGATIQSFTPIRRRSGSLSGTLYIDGTVLKETDLLEGKYYIDLHSKTAPFSATGEIRGQILFN
jgi:hypothetical protein